MYQKEPYIIKSKDPNTAFHFFFFKILHSPKKMSVLLFGLTHRFIQYSNFVVEDSQKRKRRSGRPNLFKSVVSKMLLINVA